MPAKTTVASQQSPILQWLHELTVLAEIVEALVFRSRHFDNLSAIKIIQHSIRVALLVGKSGYATLLNPAVDPVSHTST